MPSTGEGVDIDYQRWFKCRNAVAAQMVAEGWNKHARKFTDVQNRRARRLYPKG